MKSLNEHKKFFNFLLLLFLCQSYSRNIRQLTIKSIRKGIISFKLGESYIYIFYLFLKEIIEEFLRLNKLIRDR